ncbi:LON peptidase substrate-binding domain-containing protein [Poriferisphaera sp. WC338]|uniref:LON peptidase substrate-binding domain-containing protein n=1 Tax=Poriferisphaera sp. WC338 TaxID=3425129 RepID=UPI003D81754F
MPENMIDFEQPIPLFPLANCVLLPHATVPLHVFEPRYRELTKDVLDGDRLIAMAVFEGRTWREDYEGTPPLRDHVCIGYVVRHEKLHDGRYQLYLQGLCRAAIEEEIPNTPYRLAILKPTENSNTLEIDLQEQRSHLMTLLNDKQLDDLTSALAIRNWLSGEIPTATLIDQATLILCSNAEDRYKMLAESDVTTRGKWLERYLRLTKTTLQTAERLGTPRDNDGVCMN